MIIKYNTIMMRKTYITPIIKQILVDAQISLILNSYPPDGPDETSYNQRIHHFYCSNIENNA
jgi:hypothetical protein